MGTTPLHEASKGGHLDVARLLIEHGADHDAAAQSEDGTTLLHRTSKQRNVDVA